MEDYLSFNKRGFDRGVGFAIIIIVNLTALSVLGD